MVQPNNSAKHVQKQSVSTNNDRNYNENRNYTLIYATMAAAGNGKTVLVNK